MRFSNVTSPVTAPVTSPVVSSVTGPRVRREVSKLPVAAAQAALNESGFYTDPVGDIQVLASSEIYGDYRAPKPASHYQFDGTDDFAARSAGLVLSDFTFSCWICPAISTGVLFGSATNSDYIRFSTLLTLVLRVANTNVTIGISEAFWHGEWAHLAIVRSGTTVTVYRNGVSIGTETVGSGNYTFTRVGTWFSETMLYRGGMASLKVYSAAKTVSQIQSLAAETGTLSDVSNIEAYYPMIEQSGATGYDAWGSGDLTISNADTTLNGAFHATSSRLHFNPANIVGYTQSGDVVIPRNESAVTEDAVGGSLGVLGIAPNPISVSVPCLTFDGTGYIAIDDLGGTEEVTSLGGTSALSVAAGRVNGTAGTCFGFSLDSGESFICQEGAGVTLYNTGTGNNGTLTSFADPWAAKTNTVQSWRILHGGRIGSSSEFVPGVADSELCVDGEPKTLAAGKVCADGGLTVVNFNPFSKAENNLLNLETEYTGGNRSQLTPFNQKFQRTQDDGIDRFAATSVQASGSNLRNLRIYCGITYSLRKVLFPADFNNWSLCEIFKLDDDYVANILTGNLRPLTDQTLFVRSDGNNTNNGLTAGAAKLTIANAIAAATGVPLIDLGAGTFSGAGVSKPCAIVGVGPTTIISGIAVSGINLHLEAIKFTAKVSNNNGLLSVINCDFASTDTDACVANGSTRMYLVGCRSDGCAGDVYDYQGTAQGLELNCINGATTANGTVTGDNSSTMHGTSRAVRINSEYRNSPNVIHDVHDSRGMLFACIVTGGGTFNVGAAGTAEVEDTRLWFYSCDLRGDADVDIYTDGEEGVVYVDAMTQYATASVDANIQQVIVKLD